MRCRVILPPYVKSGDWLILKELKELENMIVALQVQTNDKLDKILALLLQQDRHVSSELEAAVKKVSARAVSIDKQVADLSPSK